MIKAPTLAACATLLALAAASIAPAAALETVGTGGTQATIAAAIAAVDNNGVVEIITAGTYTESLSLHSGPANYTIRKAGSVVGTVTIEAPVDGLSSALVLSATATTDQTIAIEGLTIQRPLGIGPAVALNQSTTNTAVVTFNDCIIRATGVVNADRGEALSVVAGGSAAVGPVTFTLNLNNSDLSTTSLKADSKAALRIQAATVTNFAVNSTNTNYVSFHRAIRSDGGDNQNWNLTGGTITALTERAFQLNTSHASSTVSMTGVTIIAGEECIHVDQAATVTPNNKWTLNRCTFDNTANSAGVGDQTVRITYGAATTSELNVYNCLFLLAQGVSTTNFRGLNVAGFNSTGTGTQGLYIYNNTFVGGGTGSGAAVGGTTVEANCWNNVALNLTGGDFIFGGSYSSGTLRASGKNHIVGPSDDSTPPGTDRVYTVAAAGLANALTAAGLDSNYKPLSGSILIGAGAADFNSAGITTHTKTDILSLVGSVDRTNIARSNPPDVGAFEDMASVYEWSMF